MANYDVEYFAKLNDEQVLAALLRIDKNINKLGADADKEFQKVGKSAQSSGVQIGTISGIVSGLTTEFINLGKQAVGAFVEMTKQSVDAAVAVDTLKARLGGIFDGNKEAASEAFNFIQKKSKELGLNLTELAGAFLPKSESLQQFERIAKIATALARSDPEQGATGARIALIEAQSGTFTSLQRRFEIQKKDIDRIKKAFAEGGQEGFITELEKVLKETGKSFDDLANTAQTSFDKIAITGEQFEQSFGKPILDSLKKAADELLKFGGENSTDLTVIADTFGRVLGYIVDIANSNLQDFLAGLDTKQIISIGETLFDIVDNARTFAEVLGATDVPQSLLDGIQQIADTLELATRKAAELAAQSEAGKAKAEAEAGVLNRLIDEKVGGTTGEVLKGFVGIPGLAQLHQGLSQVVGDEEAVKYATEAAQAGQDAYNKVIEDSAKIFEESKNRKDANRQATDDMRASTEASANAQDNEANSVLSAADALREKDEAAQALTDAQDKVAKAEQEAAKDNARKLEDIDIAFERKRLDIAIEFAQKREDEARKNLQKLSDLRLKYNQDVDDAAIELQRKEEDIARKQGEERINLEQEQRQKRLDVETEYRRKLQDIQAQFLLDANEAEEKRDAIGLIRALKQRDQKVTEAQTDRQRSLQDVQQEGELKREELRRQQETELEDARIANERKLEDLKSSLDRAIEAQNTAHQRELEDIQIAEARKNEEAETARQRDIEDAATAYARKLADLHESLAAEYATIAEANAATEAEQQRHIEAMNSINASYNPAYADAEIPSGTSHGPSTPGRAASTVPSGTSHGPTGGQYHSTGLGHGNAHVGRRALGGPVAAGQSVIVGEEGPEVVTPQSNSTVIPNGAIEDVLSSYQGSIQHGSAGSGTGSPATEAQQRAAMASKRSAPTLPSAPAITSNIGASSPMVSNVSSNNDVTVNLPMLDPSSFIANPIVSASIRNLVIQTVDGIL